MATLTQQRQALADAINAGVTGAKVKARPVLGNLKYLDGWVTVATLAPGQYFGSHRVTLNAYLVLGSDEKKADEEIDAVMPAMLDSTSGIYAMDVTCEPQVITADGAQPGNIYSLALTATFDIEGD